MAELHLPSDFPNRVAGIFGDAGKSWVERLPDIVDECVRRWDLELGSPFAELSVNFVVPATRSTGERVVLKVACPNPEFFTEMEALRRFKDGPSVRLLESDTDLGAFLVERVEPGTPLATITDEEKSTRIAATAMRDLPTDVEEDHPFPTLARWALVFDRLRREYDGGTGPIPNKLVEKAERLFAELETTTTERKLMHGDLHHDNLLLDGDGRWVVIDPKGVVGDPVYETARFQHNPLRRFLAYRHPQQVVNLRLDIMAEVTGFDRQRLLAWALFDSVLSVSWTAEEHGDVSTGVRRADIINTLID